MGKYVNRKVKWWVSVTRYPPNPMLASSG